MGDEVDGGVGGGHSAPPARVRGVAALFGGVSLRATQKGGARSFAPLVKVTDEQRQMSADMMGGTFKPMVSDQYGRSGTADDFEAVVKALQTVIPPAVPKGWRVVIRLAPGVSRIDLHIIRTTLPGGGS